MFKHLLSLAIATSVLTHVSRAQSTIRLADPFSSTGYVDKLIELLETPSAHDWKNSSTIQEVAGDLSQRMKIEINHRALEDMGISANTQFDGEMRSQDRSGSRRSRTSGADPFAESVQGSSPTLEPTPKPTLVATKSETEKWWDRRDTSPTNLNTVTTGARLLFLLEQLDLTLHLHRGQLQITTVEDAESKCITAVYDVSDLLPKDTQMLPGVKGAGFGGGFGQLGAGGPYYQELPDLLDSIQTNVDPETWEALGGPSTMSLLTTGERRRMVASTTLIVHWKIKSLLHALRAP